MMNKRKEAKMRKIIIILLVICLVFGLAPYTIAQSYPTQPVEFVVHAAPGSGSDFFARLVSDIINKNKWMPKPTVIVNKVGGGSAIALNYVAERNDPHTLLVTASTTQITAFMKAKIQAGIKDYTYLALMGEDVNTIAVREESPFKTVKDLIKEAKKKPKGITVGFGSVGATGHLIPFALSKMAGVEFNYLPHKSGGDAVVSLLGGRVDFVTENPDEMLPHVRAKKVRIIAFATEERVKQLPEIPTLKELGYPVVLAPARGFQGPKNTPPEVAKYLISVFKKVYDSPPFQDYLKENMMRPIFITGEEFTKYVDDYYQKLYPLIRDLGLLHK
jgi:putative tricarboxylic transport membrane protein